MTATLKRRNSPPEEPRFGTLADVEPEEIEWLWWPYIAYAMLTILEGDPGLGKSFVTMFIAAMVSIGGLLPNGTKLRRGYALVINAEDDPAYTLRPRIDALGGDPKRIRFMSLFTVLDDEGFRMLDEEIRKFPPEIIIVDPLFSYVPSDVNFAQANKIRPFLTKLAELARHVPSALVVVRHIRKALSENTLYAGAGSIDVIAVARSAIRIFEHPEDPDLRVFSHLKHNLSEEGKSWVYRIESEGEKRIPKLVWEGECDLRSEDANRGEGREPKTSKLDAAKNFLLEALKEGPQLAADMEKRATEADHSQRTISRAKADLGITSERKSLGGGRLASYWKLPKA